MDKIIDLISDGEEVAIKNNIPTFCLSFGSCDGCLMFNQSENGSCDPGLFKKWANEEYVPPEVDWEKVPIDTPIYVWNGDGEKCSRHFAGIARYGSDVQICAWNHGRTSFTTINKSPWDHAELAEPHPEWVKKKEEGRVTHGWVKVSGSGKNAVVTDMVITEK